MSSCTREDGQPKVKYPTARVAKRVARLVRTSPHGKLAGRARAYRCPDCGNYHVGHSYVPGEERDSRE